MPEKIPHCPKCNGEMEDGFVADRIDSGQVQQKWVEGQPQQSFWTGLKISDKRRFKVVSYRCTQCGFIESYARERAID